MSISIHISAASISGMVSATSGASMSMPPQQKMSNLFSQIDPSSKGAITQSQFNQAFQTMNPPTVFKAAGSTAVWNKLDPTGTGQVSRQDFVNGMKNLMVQLRQETGASGAAQTSINAAHSLDQLG